MKFYAPRWGGGIRPRGAWLGRERGLDDGCHFDKALREPADPESDMLERIGRPFAASGQVQSAVIGYEVLLKLAQQFVAPCGTDHICLRIAPTQ